MLDVFDFVAANWGWLIATAVVLTYPSEGRRRGEAVGTRAGNAVALVQVHSGRDTITLRVVGHSASFLLRRNSLWE
jgi:hypothetical protein